MEGAQWGQTLCHQGYPERCVIFSPPLVSGPSQRDSSDPVFRPHAPPLPPTRAVEDARRAADTPGVDGIVVSNHAGRQVDGAIGSLDALEAIVRSGVGEKVTVMFDSCVTSSLCAVPGVAGAG